MLLAGCDWWLSPSPTRSTAVEVRAQTVMAIHHNWIDSDKHSALYLFLVSGQCSVHQLTVNSKVGFPIDVGRWLHFEASNTEPRPLLPPLPVWYTDHLGEGTWIQLASLGRRAAVRRGCTLWLLLLTLVACEGQRALVVQQCSTTALCDDGLARDS